MFTPKEKATGATVAHGAFQRSSVCQDISTNILFMQGQIIQNPPKPHILDGFLGENGGCKHERE